MSQQFGDNSFLAQVTANGYKKGIFFKIKNNKIKATAARYCALAVCRILTFCQNTITGMGGFYGIVIIYFKENTFFVFTSNNLSQK
jgi:hypothetical protein